MPDNPNHWPRKWSGAEMRCPKCNKYLPDRCTCNGPSIEEQRSMTTNTTLAATGAAGTDSTAPMCERKTNHIIERDGYAKTGYVLKKAGAQVCVSDGGAVAWFTPAQWHWLMFNRDHVTFDWPAPIGAPSPATRGERPAWWGNHHDLQVDLGDLATYPSPHGTLVRLADVKCRVAQAEQAAELDVEAERREFEQAANAARFFPRELDFSLRKSPSGKRDEYVNSHLQSRWEGWLDYATRRAATCTPAKRAPGEAENG